MAVYEFVFVFVFLANVMSTQLTQSHALISNNQVTVDVSKYSKLCSVFLISFSLCFFDFDG